ncbi:hypothetical protein PsorP6_000924 [Peronosclerospora sorghi]|uniref:Uncharacterized protein n=1 Tax=Peronosclerospora sorghi TaxID=230839 RepID=A0ACC0WSL3_9STRA|nr:hypothetical protein PsorP6_000924 [Peronosclerospora sorghi]
MSHQGRCCASTKNGTTTWCVHLVNDCHEFHDGIVPRDAMTAEQRGLAVQLLKSGMKANAVTMHLKGAEKLNVVGRDVYNVKSQALKTRKLVLKRWKIPRKRSDENMRALSGSIASNRKKTDSGLPTRQRVQFPLAQSLDFESLAERLQGKESLIILSKPSTRGLAPNRHGHQESLQYALKQWTRQKWLHFLHCWILRTFQMDAMLHVVGYMVQLCDHKNSAVPYFS